MIPTALFQYALFLGIGLQCVQMKLYTNRWAVKITGGPDAAFLIAEKYGFVNMGQVSKLLKNILAVNLASCVKSNIFHDLSTLI